MSRSPFPLPPPPPPSAAAPPPPAPRRARVVPILMLFSALVAGVLVYVFYASPLRDHVENKLFDIRTRLSPNVADTDDVAVVTIDAATIAAMEPAGTKDLSYPALLRVAEAALATRATAVAVLVPPQVFPYNEGLGDGGGLDRLAALARRDKRLILGTFDLSTKAVDAERLPAALADPLALRQVVKADVERYFRREIVRDFVVRSAGELPYLAWRLTTASGTATAARSLAAARARAADGKIIVKLNYFATKLLHQVKAERLVADPAGQGGALADRIVLVGYTAFRPWTLRAREATLVNSPWQVDGSDVENGIPVVMVQAIALVNLMRNIWLTTAPLTANVVQTLLITLVTLGIWRLSVGFASFLFIGGWSVILLLHALLFSVGNVYLPLADAALASSLAMISGALWRLRLDGRLRALQEARASSEAELAAVQDRFLNRFAFALAAINSQAKAQLERPPVHQVLTRAGGAAGQAYVRALGSCEELDDYLQGIQHFAALQGEELRRPPLVAVDVADVVAKVVRQFESRLQEARVEAAVTGPTRCVALADPTVVAQVVYNLISNGLKYSPAGARLRVRIGRGTHTATVRVEDDGPGIAAEFHERIFEKFYRVKDDYVYKFKGHGLGLYLSRYFAAQIDASLDVDSEPGQGAAFTLTMRSAPS